MPSFAIDISTQHSVTGFAASSDCTFRIRGVVGEIAERLEVLLLDLLHQCYSKSCCKSCQVHTVRYFLFVTDRTQPFGSTTIGVIV